MDHFQYVWTIFNSYVKLPEGTFLFFAEQTIRAVVRIEQYIAQVTKGIKWVSEEAVQNQQEKQT